MGGIDFFWKGGDMCLKFRRIGGYCGCRIFFVIYKNGEGIDIQQEFHTCQQGCPPKYPAMDNNK